MAGREGAGMEGKERAVREESKISISLSFKRLCVSGLKLVEAMHCGLEQTRIET